MEPDDLRARPRPPRLAVGERIYENRYVIWGRLAWGRMQEYEVYEDTQKAKALDDWLAVHEPRGGLAGGGLAS